MTDERLQVLEMVAAGTITAEQGSELLDALGDEPEPRFRAHREVRQAREERRGRRRNSVFHELTEAKLHGVGPEYIQEMREAGFGDAPLKELIEARIHGVDGEFVGSLRSAGFPDLSLHEVIEAKIHGLDPAFIEAMRTTATFEEDQEEA
jgi:hypothetical protein